MKRTAKSVRAEAEKQLSERNYYQISVKIGICYYTFKIKRIGSNYVLYKNQDVEVDYRTSESQIVTDLLDRVTYYL